MTLMARENVLLKGWNTNTPVFRALKKLNATVPLAILLGAEPRERVESTKATEKKLTTVIPTQGTIAAATFGWSRGERTGRKKRTPEEEGADVLGAAGGYE